MKTYYFAIDIGASSGRHIVGWLEDGKIMLKEIYRFANGAKMRAGRLFWDAERLFSEVLNGLKAAGEMGYKPRYIGIDTWAVDYALLDNKCAILDDVYCYRDDRTEEFIPAVHAAVPFEKLTKRTGIQF